ncbi:MAG: hypothetical protein J3Q66DRAFT_412968 [Benniella sp.]|nr:MAG: hypothetical protein J3Q66DRAFT_412968 [Benniella sp.]
MRLQPFAFLAVVCTVALALEDPAQPCTGAAACDTGFCCSSHGFCGRSAYYYNQSSDCNIKKGSCGIVPQDKQDLPRVVAHDQLNPNSINGLVKKLLL